MKEFSRFTAFYMQALILSTPLLVIIFLSNFFVDDLRWLTMISSLIIFITYVSYFIFEKPQFIVHTVVLKGTGNSIRILTLSVAVGALTLFFGVRFYDPESGANSVPFLVLGLLWIGLVLVAFLTAMLSDPKG